MSRLPKNRPEKYQKQGGKKVVVLAGDSITHGQIGENYVAMLSERLYIHKFDLVNAGINSHMAWNLLQRIDEIIACEPDFITIMIGTNDANAVTSEAEAKEYVKRMGLPRMPDQEWYQESLHKIVTTLLERTHAKIGLISIPPIGEIQDHFAFKI
ncbi:MAG: SGNH/GDSL hydrolase family protein, partial [Candidatus Thorarchaeota archaeon]|nr:SGNH/GDSL hydrolase family protein [Candidatus Thorarchaeota archaeon]